MNIGSFAFAIAWQMQLVDVDMHVRVRACVRACVRARVRPSNPSNFGFR
jgi:hypothetical protein